MIYYSHINEDNRVERTLLNNSACSTVVAICGSGERVLSLMDNKCCSRFFIVDFNEEAINLLLLKLEALKKLPVEEYLEFLGHSNSTKRNRLYLFEKIKTSLPSSTIQFWERNKKAIENGILHSGHFEKFLGRVRPLTNFYLGRRFQNIFIDNYQEKKFPRRRWKILRQLFSYKLVYQLGGNRDKAFVGKKAYTNQIPNALDETIRNNKASSSFMTHLIFKGHLLEMRDNDLPPSLQKNILAAIKQRLLNEEIVISYHVSDFMEFLSHSKELPNQDVFYSISDILSFVDFKYLLEIIKRISSTGNIVVGRSFLRNRLTLDQLNELRLLGDVRLYDDEESTGMYQVFLLKP